MAATIDPLEFAKALIAAPSVTPASGAVFDVLEAALAPLGFAVQRWVMQDVENMVARRGTGAPHLAFAGHLDVVPPGEGWASGAFQPEVRGNLLYGRGAVDMKSSIAAFVAACADECAHDGTISLLITGDEEGEADHGTREIIAYLQRENFIPDLCLVGEPTSVNRLGDTIKIGRRGSLNGWIIVPGTQGHVAYPHLADNPAPKLVRILAALNDWVIDAGNAWFQPSNLEVTALEAGGKAANVIPAEARARISIRFNDAHQGAALLNHVTEVAQAIAPDARVDSKVYGEAFLTPPGELSALVSAAIEAETGVQPE
ncbi:MAG: succinyl-diaminopimelate desuccinylase, partial [Alphaproteobacteria bacterium]|nr:succinyl-diaminopimelate desuccinylase [Alphaproteobacteria bacterium]